MKQYCTLCTVHGTYSMTSIYDVMSTGHVLSLNLGEVVTTLLTGSLLRTGPPSTVRTLLLRTNCTRQVQLHTVLYTSVQVQ